MDERAVDRFVRSALESDPPLAGPHSDPDALFAYFARELSPAEADVVQAHVARCPECARVVADFEAFPALDAPSEDDVPSEADTAAGWADLLERLEREPVSDELGQLAAREARRPDVLPFPRARPAAPARPAWRQGAFQTLLATAALVVLGLGTTLFNTRRYWATPEANPDIDDIGQAEQVRGALGEPDHVRGSPDEAPGPKRIRRGSRIVTLAIAFVGEPNWAYRVEVRNGQNPARSLWVVDDVRLDAARALYIALPGEDLPAGRYRVLVYPPSSPTPIVEYDFEIAYDP